MEINKGSGFYASAREKASRMYGRASSFGGTRLGQSVKIGTLESFGWNYAPGTASSTPVSQGFAGHKEVSKMSGGAFKKGAAYAFRLTGAAFTGFAAYAGYKEGGVAGAVGGVAASTAMNVGMHYVFSSLSSPVLWGAAGMAAVGMGGYLAGEKAQAYRKNMKTLEMGANIVDPFGTSATLRQRSMRALQNSKINGRMGIGNEALIMHRSF